MPIKDKRVLNTAILLALVAGFCAPAQAQALMGRNLIVNGDAEADQGVTSKNDTKTVPPSGWKVTGTPTAAWLYQFSVLLNDSSGDSVTSTYTLEVFNTSPVI